MGAALKGASRQIERQTLDRKMQNSIECFWSARSVKNFCKAFYIDQINNGLTSSSIPSLNMKGSFQCQSKYIYIRLTEGVRGAESAMRLTPESRAGGCEAGRGTEAGCECHRGHGGALHHQESGHCAYCHAWCQFLLSWGQKIGQWWRQNGIILVHF